MDEDSGSLLNTVSLMPDDGIIWAPNADFDDMRVLVVPKGITVGVNAALHVNPKGSRDAKYHEDYVAISKVVLIK